MDRQTGAFVRPFGDQLARLHIAVKAVLRAEQRDQLHTRRAAQQVNRGLAVMVDAGRIRDEPDALSLQLFETIRGERLAAELHLRRRDWNDRQRYSEKTKTNQ